MARGTSKAELKVAVVAHRQCTHLTSAHSIPLLITVVKVKRREASLIRGYCGGSEKWRMQLELELAEETGDEGGERRMRRFVDESLWSS